MHLLHVTPGAAATLKLQSEVDAIDLCLDLDELDLWFGHADYDAVLLDPMADRGFGRRWAQRYRARGGRASLAFVVDDISPDVAIPFYGVCDDLVRLPIRPDELLARLGAVTRRCRGYESACLTAGALAIDLATLRARYGGHDLRLTKIEFTLLEFLMLRAGQVVSRDSIMTRLYQERDEAHIKIIDVLVCKLRKKLAEADAPPDVIRTAWGNGFSIARTMSPTVQQLRSVA